MDPAGGPGLERPSLGVILQRAIRSMFRRQATSACSSQVHTAVTASSRHADSVRRGKEGISMTPKSVLRGLAVAATLLLVLAVGGRAWAQGMFYAEETKDGRIYVFNIKDNWERFKASGEVGTGITKLGAGPNGETVYADNEQALDLFFFKHGIKESVARPRPATLTIVWRDGKTRFTVGDNFYLELSSR